MSRGTGCGRCTTAGLAEVFGERRSKKDAKRFRRKGLDRRAERLLDAVIAAGPDTAPAASLEAGSPNGTTSLEIGAGVGGFSLTLLEHGIHRAVAIDASPAAARVARELANERGLADRFSIEQADFATLRLDERYDIVVLNSVVCCYPDWRGLLMPGAAATRHVLALTYPLDTWYNKAFAATINGVQALLRKEFRFHIHPPARMLDVLRAAGLRPRAVGRDWPWELVVARRES